MTPGCPECPEWAGYISSFARAKEMREARAASMPPLIPLRGSLQTDENKERARLKVIAAYTLVLRALSLQITMSASARRVGLVSPLEQGVGQLLDR